MIAQIGEERDSMVLPMMQVNDLNPSTVIYRMGYCIMNEEEIVSFFTSLKIGRGEVMLPQAKTQQDMLVKDVLKVHNVMMMLLVLATYFLMYLLHFKHSIELWHL